MPNSAPLPRRLAAVVYDAVAAVAVVYFAAFVPVIAAGDAIAPGSLPLLLYVIGSAFAYFGLCWRRGRTLGMVAWKLVVLDARGRRGLSARSALLRFAAAGASLATLGLGYAWALIDREGRTLHDRVSGTRIVREEDASGAGVTAPGS